MSRSTAAEWKWRGIVDEQTSTRQTVAEYCRRRGIAASSLFYWRRRLRSARGAAVFVEAGVISEPSDSSGADAIQIICGQRRIAVHAGFDPDVLREAIKVLEGLPSKLEALA
jgi:hypothetical protein